MPHKAPYRSLNNREMMSGREKKTAVAKFSSCPSVAAGDQSQGECGEVGSPSPLLRSCSAAISTTVHTFRPPGLKCALLTPGLPNPSCLLLVSKTECVEICTVRSDFRWILHLQQKVLQMRSVLVHRGCLQKPVNRSDRIGILLG